MRSLIKASKIKLHCTATIIVTCDKNTKLIIVEQCDTQYDNEKKRTHLLTDEDIVNIKKAYKLRGVQHHSNNSMNVALWVEEMRQRVLITLFFSINYKEGRKQQMTAVFGRG